MPRPSILASVECWAYSLILVLGREDEWLTTLAYLRSGVAEDNIEVQYEIRSLQAERIIEREAARERYGVDTVSWRTSMLDYKRLFTTKSLLRRLMPGAMAQGLQQWTGINGMIKLIHCIKELIRLK